MENHKITITFETPKLLQSEIDSFKECNPDKEYSFETSVVFEEFKHKIFRLMDNFNYSNLTIKVD